MIQNDYYPSHGKPLQTVARFAEEIQCGNSTKLASRIWSEWGPWSNCKAQDGRDLECKDNKDGRGNGEWNKSKKIRERKCLTGIDCIGKWFEKVLCKKADFKRLELRRCPCTYEDSKFNVTKVYFTFKAFIFSII